MCPTHLPNTVASIQYSTQVSVDSKLLLKGRTIKNSNKHHYPPVQIIFCLKERHTKKLNSHRWFFNGLCPLLKPRITLLTTAGTKIGNGSLFHLWNAFDRNPHTAGACGEIRVAKGFFWWKVLNPIIAAQIFEYKVSSILEKPFESIFGYISVMPGALVAYRYEALLPEPISGKGPLTAYFEPDYLVFSDDHREVGEVLQYSYFSEDQILPFLVTTRRNASYTMQYVRSAWAETELPAGIGSFLGMKRKWQNRRFFGLIYAVSNVRAIWRSGHNLWRKLWLTLEIIYLGCDTAFWFLALVGRSSHSHTCCGRSSRLTNTLSFDRVLGKLLLGVLLHGSDTGTHIRHCHWRDRIHDNPIRLHMFDRRGDHDLHGQSSSRAITLLVHSQLHLLCMYPGLYPLCSWLSDLHPRH